jgi:hypothetical protein
MLGSITPKAERAGVAILYFAKREEAAKAHGHEFGTTVPKRPFFDVSDFTSEAALRRAALALLKKASEGAGIPWDK